MCNTCKKAILNHAKAKYAAMTVQLFQDTVDTIKKCPAMKALEELTPGGSEFWEDPEFCLKMLKDQRANTHRLLVKTCGERNELAAEKWAGPWSTGLVGKDLEALTNAIDRDLAVIRRTCRHCLGEYTGTAFAICSECGRFQ